MIIRPAADGAADELSGLVNRVYETSERGLWRDGFARTSETEMAGFIVAGEILVAVEDDRTLGCVRTNGAEFGMLAAADRGHGVGRALVDFVERDARARGRRTLELELLVPRERIHPDKEFLRVWYARRGYRRTGSTPMHTAYPRAAPLLLTPCDITRWGKDLSEVD